MEHQPEFASIAELKEAAARKRAETSKARLKEIAARKGRKCFAVALSEFETAFGMELWGLDMPESELTEKQKAHRRIWRQARARILETANRAIEELQDEIELHTVRYDGYHAEFIVNPPRRDDVRGR